MADGTEGLATGIRCLAAVLNHHGLHASAALLAGGAIGDETPFEALARMAEEQGLSARSLDLAENPTEASVSEHVPVIVHLRNGNMVVVVGFTGPDSAREVVIFDPLASSPGRVQIALAQLVERWDGAALTFARMEHGDEPKAPFNLGWFVPQVLKEKRILRDVVLAGVALQVVGLAVPIFFQIVIDKVLVHHAVETLKVLLVGVVIALCFETAFVYLRQYLLLYATRRVDVRVATGTFQHLLSLPIGFFECHPAGVLAKHMQQAERVRQFLTGRLLLTLLDASMLVLIIPLLAYYSIVLTGVVLAFAAALALTLLIASRPFRERLRRLYTAEGLRQSMLVETIHGVGTVKALGLEWRQRGQWDHVTSLVAETSFDVGRVSAVARAVTNGIEKLATISTVGFGALLAFDSNLSVGALVAFMMLSNRVLGPLAQMATLLQEYQEIALSVRMLGTIMDAEPERRLAGGGLRPATFEGDVTLEGVCFRYPGATSDTLQDISFNCPAGAMVAIVGPSGSGKSTIARLILGLYSQYKGIIRVDGQDLRILDLSNLRSRTGVVLQDSFLFRGSVRDNIAAGKPGASFRDVVRAAELAGASEFIERLPSGFGTPLEEGGANLSSGQRQRLAIARALVRSPNILILDEATSALDPESERIIQDNLRAITRGRTTIVISHRLATIIEAKMILVVEGGRLVGAGIHDGLLETCSTYRKLWQIQTEQRFARKA